VATVSSSGLVAPLVAGTTTLTATYQSVSGTFAISVYPSVAGTWTDSSIVDAGKLERDGTAVIWALTQNGASVTGTATLNDPSFTALNISGAFTGSFTNTTLGFSFALSGISNKTTQYCQASTPESVALTGTAQVSGTTLSATVTQLSVSCNGTMVSTQTGTATATFTKQ
jgi:hypothetical protein